MSSARIRPQETTDAAICHTPSCHSRENVRAVTTRSGDESGTGVATLCGQCRKQFLGVTS